MAVLAVAPLRDGLTALTVLAARDLNALYRRITTAAAAGEALNDLLPAIISTYGAAAATLAADWYEEQRDKLGITGRFRAIPADPGDGGAHALVGWALATAVDDETFRTLIDGGTQRRIAAYSRQTITDSAIGDPRADGWQRQGAGECAFCAMLIGRGAVYSEASADFASHDHCRCVAVPAFGGQERPVKPFTPSPRTSTVADRTRVREWLATH